jgi:mRNA interferase MazF
MPKLPKRAEIWLAELDPVRGHEQAGRRPVLVVSDDRFNRSLAQLAVVLPLTTTARAIPYHVPIDPPEGNVRRRSFIKCEDVRSIAFERIIERWGAVESDTMARVEEILRILLRL